LHDVDGHAPMWKKKSMFWDLPYLEFLDVRSAIDVMHVMKNLCMNLLGLLGVYGKTKDTDCLVGSRSLCVVNDQPVENPKRKV
jgi:hypothetical protein